MLQTQSTDLESRSLLRKRLQESRSHPYEWQEIKSVSCLNPFCKEYEKTFLGFDHYYQKPAWRKVRIFTSKRKSRKSPVIMIPPTGGLSPLDQLLASRLASQGYPTYVLSSFEGWDDYSATVSRHDRQSVQSISALRELQAWLKKPCYIIGASLGAMYGLQAFANDPQVKKLVLAVGGENFAGIMTDSKLAIATRNKLDRMKKFNLKSDYEYRAFMKSNFIIDPGLFVRNEKQSRKYLLFVSDNDTIVPTPYQESLVRHLPDAQVIRLKSGHIMSVVRFYLFFQREILKFLKSEDTARLEWV